MSTILLIIRTPAEVLWEENDMENHHNHVISGSSVVFGDGHESRTFSSRTSCKHLDVEELEMLLEAYFVQIDSTLNKLSTVIAFGPIPALTQFSDLYVKQGTPKLKLHMIP